MNTKQCNEPHCGKFVDDNNQHKGPHQGEYKQNTPYEEIVAQDKELERLKAIWTSDGKNNAATDVSRSIVEIELVLEEVPCYKPEIMSKKLSEQEIIQKIARGDVTAGSCVSVALAYIANMSGFDVLDFRGDKGLEVFANPETIAHMCGFQGVQSKIVENSNAFQAVYDLLKTVDVGKEYFLGTGNHAAIVRLKSQRFEYLELQSGNQNGFMPLTYEILCNRFVCKETQATQKNILIECQSLGQSTEFQKLLGYINNPTKNI